VRVLFLYYHFPQAEPLLKCRAALLEHDVLLESHQIESPEERAPKLPNHILPSITEYLQGDFDLLVIQHQIMQEDVLFCRRPVVIMERTDGAQLESRHWLPHIAGLIKNYALRPRSLNNQFYGRYSARLIKGAGIEAENTRVVPGFPPPLSDAELEKIVIGYGFASYPRFDLAKAQFVDLTSPRCYAGQLRCQHGYKQTEIGRAREVARDAMQAVSELHPGEILCGPEIPYEDYLREMTRVKTVVSPWGWGEPCHRDYEAWLLGAVLIKPNTDFVEAWPDTYRSGEFYVPCAVDFSDLNEVIYRVANNWDDYLPMRLRAREAVLEAMEPSHLASRMVGIFRRFA